MEIPNNFGQWTIIWSQANNPRLLACTSGYFNPGAHDPATVLTRLRNSGEASVDGLFDAVNFGVGTTLERLYCLQNRAGVLESGVLDVGTDGTMAGNSQSINTCIVVAKDTARAGRQFRGRFEWPSTYVNETDISQTAEIDAGVLNAIQARFVTFHSNLQANGIGPVLLHSQPKDPLAPIPIPTEVTNFTVRTQLGSARRRLKRFTG